MKTIKYLVRFVNYTNLNAAFKSRKAAKEYMNNICKTFGIHVYMDGNILSNIQS